MKFRYEFNNGDIEEIEVAGEWYDALVALEAEEKRNERRETRRHIPLGWHNREDGEDFDSPHFIDPRADVPAEALLRMDSRSLRAALDKLNPTQRELVVDIYSRGISATDVARRDGVSKVAISRRLNRALKKLCEILSPDR